MTSDREGHFLWLAEALTRFKATEAEVLAHCKAGRIAAVYVSEEGPNGIRVCVEDMRKLFEETGDPARPFADLHGLDDLQAGAVDDGDGVVLLVRDVDRLRRGAGRCARTTGRRE